MVEHDGTAGSQSPWSWSDGATQDRTSRHEEFHSEADGERLARQIQRELVRRTGAEERESFYAEHGQLVEKEFRENLSIRDRARLNYVRWQLDRFEDAEIGDRLDELSALAKLHREIAEDVKTFADQAVLASKSRGRQK